MASTSTKSSTCLDSFDLDCPGQRPSRAAWPRSWTPTTPDPDTVFDPPLAHRGTAFQRKVWDAISPCRVAA